MGSSPAVTPRGLRIYTQARSTPATGLQPDPPDSMTTRSPALPVLFVSHGAPTLALDARAGADFARLAAAMPVPRAVLVVSAHWLDAPATLGTRTQRELLYDFSGFPPELYRLRYAAPAAAALAEQLPERIPSLARADERPWDHGVWVPLMHMYPQATVPVLQLSMPWRWTPKQMFDLGHQLAPLRADGVLVLASGGAVHNLGRLAWGGGGKPPPWAVNFESWVREKLAADDVDALLSFREKAPDLNLAHPSDDHFVPLLVALGAGTRAQVTFPIEGWDHGSLSRLAVRWG